MVRGIPSEITSINMKEYYLSITMMIIQTMKKQNYKMTSVCGLQFWTPQLVVRNRVRIGNRVSVETKCLRAGTGLCELCSTTWLGQVGRLKEWENSIDLGIVSPQITGEIKWGCKAECTHIYKKMHTPTHRPPPTHTHSCTQFPETGAVDLGTFMFFLCVCVSFPAFDYPWIKPMMIKVL